MKLVRPDLPRHSIILPSNKKAMTFRPLLVKEEKVLLMALESGDEVEMLRAIRNMVAGCLEIEPEEVRKMCQFDLEYLLLQIRSKSVKEVATPGFQCPKCEQFTTVEVPLDKIVVDFPEESATVIKLGEHMCFRMRYLNLQDGETKVEETAEKLLDAIANCVVSITIDETTHAVGSDITPEEVKDFFDGLTQDEFGKILAFFRNPPSISYAFDFKCKHCEHEQKMEVRGIKSFFPLLFPIST